MYIMTPIGDSLQTEFYASPIAFYIVIYIINVYFFFIQLPQEKNSNKFK